MGREAPSAGLCLGSRCAPVAPARLPPARGAGPAGTAGGAAAAPEPPRPSPPPPVPEAAGAEPALPSPPRGPGRGRPRPSPPRYSCGGRSAAERQCPSAAAAEQEPEPAGAAMWRAALPLLAGLSLGTGRAGGTGSSGGGGTGTVLSAASGMRGWGRRAEHRPPHFLSSGPPFPRDPPVPRDPRRSGSCGGAGGVRVVSRQVKELNAFNYDQHVYTRNRSAGIYGE